MGPMIVAWLLTAPAEAAEAAEGLVWTWDAPRRYLLELDLVPNRALLLQAEKNIEARVPAINLKIDTTCSVFEDRKTATDLRCTLDDLGMQVLPFPADVGRVTPVLDEIESTMKKAYVQLTLGKDGKVRSIDLEGLETQNVNDRVRNTQEVMRLILVRAFAAFDLELPPEGVTPESGVWTHNGSEIVGFPSMNGTTGSVPIDIRIARTAGTVLTLSTKGSGTAGPGDAQGRGSIGASSMYDLTVSGWANFDTATHAITGRQYEVSGPPTASSGAATGDSSVNYLQKVRMTLVKEGDPPPQVGANGEYTAP